MTKLCAQTLCAKGKMKTLQSTIIPSNVGKHDQTLCANSVRKGKNEYSSIYNYSLKCWHYISIIKTYNPPRYILPNCWHDISNTHKGLQLCEMLQTV